MRHTAHALSAQSIGRKIGLTWVIVDTDVRILEMLYRYSVTKIQFSLCKNILTTLMVIKYIKMYTI